MFQFRLRSLFAFILVISCILAIIRSWPFTSKHAFNQVKNGMTKAEVIELLGPPYAESSGTDSYVYVYQGFISSVYIIEFNPKTKTVESTYQD
jgi:outer membrane protein assembly factor BamE (lipoprotein component of BamABCDE complex)